MNGPREDGTDTAGFGPRFALPVLLGPALNSVNTTMIAVALVPISRATGTEASGVILLVTALYVASAVSQPVLGRLVDRYGPKRLYVAGMALAAAAGLVPLLAPTFAGALVSRVAVGIGTSAAYPAAMTAIRNRSVRTGREPPRGLFSALSVSSLVSAAVGPVLGGVLVESFGWQAIFVVNTPYAVVAAACALAGLPSDRTHQRPEAPGGRSRRFPMLRVLAARPELLRTYGRMFLVHACTYLVVYGLTPWMQAAAGYTADAAGWMQLPGVVLAGAAAALVSRVRGVRVPLVVAAAVPIAGGLLLTRVDADASVWLLLAVIVLFGPPQGLAAVSNQVVLHRQAPAGRMGVVSGLSRTAVQLSAIAASGVIGPVFGATPTDAGLHALGWIIAGLGAAALSLTAADPGLRRR
ncbi:MFS transporter [Nocardiopsis changdeensis]|uniref:MFS transporter n=1 Tax=Nocardiopsis changdeensis TaxID=2831969 RepID=UPI003F48F070